MTLLERLRVVAASLRDFDHADDHIEVDTRDVSALLTEAADAIEATTVELQRAEEGASLHASEGVRLGERYAAANARAVRAEMECDAARAEVARYQQREEHFANALRVADGGQYRNDWDGAIRRVLADRDAARAEVDRLLRLASGPHINEVE